MAGLHGEGGRWDEFDVAAEAFHEMIEEQKESLKGALEEEVMQLNQVRERRRSKSPGADPAAHTRASANVHSPPREKNDGALGRPPADRLSPTL